MSIRIFVGCAANNEDIESMAVLDYTLHKFASKPIDIEWMMQSRDPASFWNGWNTANWATPFSGFRWGIPARCGFKGRAIYMDSDMIVRDDIAQLFRQVMHPRQGILSKGDGMRYCVMVMECQRLEPFMIPIETLKSDPSAYKSQRSKLAEVDGLLGKFDGNWNCLDGENYESIADPAIKCLHYTAIACQPQLKYAVPRLRSEGLSHWFKGTPTPHFRKDVTDLFDRALGEAIAAGFVPENYRREPFGNYTRGCDGGAYARRDPEASRQSARGHAMAASTRA